MDFFYVIKLFLMEFGELQACSWVALYLLKNYLSNAIKTLGLYSGFSYLLCLRCPGNPPLISLEKFMASALSTEYHSYF